MQVVLSAATVCSRAPGLRWGEQYSNGVTPPDDRGQHGRGTWGRGLGVAAAHSRSVSQCEPTYPTIARAARSAMSMTGALVLPGIMLGIAESIDHSKSGDAIHAAVGVQDRGGRPRPTAGVKGSHRAANSSEDMLPGRRLHSSSLTSCGREAYPRCY
jgi:hypothetical protein